LGVVDDRAQLREVRRPQHVLDVAHRLAHERGDRGGVDLEEGAARRLDDPAGRQVEEPVLGVVRADGQHVGVVETGHLEKLTGKWCGGRTGYRSVRLPVVRAPGRACREKPRWEWYSRERAHVNFWAASTTSVP